jgi:hypothetical protein
MASQTNPEDKMMLDRTVYRRAKNATSAFRVANGAKAGGTPELAIGDSWDYR